MIDTTKRRKLSHQILALTGLCAGISLLLFLLLSGIATAVAEEYCFQRDIAMTEFDWILVDRWIFGVSAFLSCCSYSVMFLVLLRDRLAYIRKITAGIDQLYDPENAVDIPLEDSNELTVLARAINDMSRARQQLRKKEQALAEEKEQLIRTLCHDIRTPLTAILAYSDYLARQDGCTAEEQEEYLCLIQNKAQQIRDLTALLLDGDRCNLEQFEDGKLLMEQITAEFEESLEHSFFVQLRFDRCPAFSARLDVQQLRRVFDNLASNVCKYADPALPVTLEVSLVEGKLLIRQTNGVLRRSGQAEGYGLGLDSIRRIAASYSGSVTVEEKDGQFRIDILLRDI